MLVLPASVLLSAAPALASGFGFYEQGAKASGQGGAWVARADDASSNWYDPAALVHLTGPDVQLGFNYLQIGNDTQFSPAPGVSFDAVSNTVTPAHFYFGAKLGGRWAWGVGFNSPFGLVSEWKDPPLTFSSRRADLRTFLFNPNIAYKLSDRWSIAVGADYLAAEVREFSHDIAFPTLSTANLTGEGDSWGFNVAVQFKMDCFSLAGQYRSTFHPTIYGNVDFGNGLGVLDSKAHAKIDLPAQTMLGAAWTSKWVDVEAGGYYTSWNQFKQLDIETGNPATSVSLAENWRATWSYRLGLAFRLDASGHNELRAGGVYDETPIPTEFLRPSIPDANRTEFSLGYGYQAKHWGVDLYGMHIQFADRTANGLLTDGVINGTYTSTVWLAGVTAKYRF
jgi:long-chain fatty acid transport protein